MKTLATTRFKEANQGVLRKSSAEEEQRASGATTGARAGNECTRADEKGGIVQCEVYGDGV